MATKNQTRPSCAKVKIEVDLTAKLPQRIRINEEDDITGEIKHKWIKVQYDHMPKYCKECCLQGHDEGNCWSIHPELYELRIEDAKQKKEGEVSNSNKEMAGEIETNRDGVRGVKQSKQEWMVRSTNKYKRDKYGHIEGENIIQTGNSFEAIREEEEKEIKEGESNNSIGGTKEWVTKTFENCHDNETTNKQGNTEIDKVDNKGTEKGESLNSSNSEQEEEDEKEEANTKGALVITNVNDEEILPLAIRDDIQREMYSDDQALEVQQNDEVHQQSDESDKVGMENNIAQITRDGDLSPKQTVKLKENHSKAKKQGGEDLIAAQASSRQSKRVIIKNPKYQ